MDNKSSATIRGELTKANVTNGLGYTPIKDGGVPEVQVGLESGKPTATGSGLLYVATDSQRLWHDDAVSKEWIMLGGSSLIPGEDTVNFIVKQEEFVATEGQETFHLLKGSYVPNSNSISWFMEGIKQSNASLQEISSTSFKLIGGVPKDSKVLVEYYELMIGYPYPVHGEDHLTGGFDPIPKATASKDGLMPKEDKSKLGVIIPISQDLEILKKTISMGDKIIPNSLVIHPMEGCDGTVEGKPDELTYRRYERFARGGAGLLWFEATAVVEEGRANPRQIYICPENKEDFKKLLDQALAAAREDFGHDYRPYTVVQLTHSGRYSRPTGKPAPIIATRNPYLGRDIPEDYPLITDQELERLEDKFVEAAVLAKEVGFDAVDIKACHGYLNSELLSAFTRKASMVAVLKIVPDSY